MPLFHLFGLDDIELRSFGEAVFLVGLRWFLTALLATLMGSSLCLLQLILQERARDNEDQGAAARGADGVGVVAGPPPCLLLRRFAPVE
jgi:hypothetical protein